ncbi:MAG TPA: hypothetical protein VLS51_11045 [Propionibacteriaceae bacterium]|nr:hypothetical protein [Propionibacteriaceae bacterium]
MTSITELDDLQELQVNGTKIVDKDGDMWTWNGSRWEPAPHTGMVSETSAGVIQYAPIQVLEDMRKPRMDISSEEAHIILGALSVATANLERSAPGTEAAQTYRALLDRLTAIVDAREESA